MLRDLLTGFSYENRDCFHLFLSLVLAIMSALDSGNILFCHDQLSKKSLKYFSSVLRVCLQELILRSSPKLHKLHDMQATKTGVIF